MVDLAVKAARGRAVDIGVTQFGADERASELAEELGRRVPHVQNSMLVEASAIIGAHVGPGALAIAVSPAA
jgi:fatty acid-binding protein DegV